MSVDRYPSPINLLWCKLVQEINIRLWLATASFQVEPITMGLLKVCLMFCLIIAVVVENRRITKLERIENVLKRTNRILNDLKREGK